MSHIFLSGHGGYVMVYHMRGCLWAALFSRTYRAHSRHGRQGAWSFAGIVVASGLWMDELALC
jgi:hypothetical protein